MQETAPCKVRVIAWTEPKLFAFKWKFTKQTQRIMKLIAFLMLAAVLQVSAKGVAQEKITISLDNAPLEQVLNSIKKQSGYYFIYRQDMVAGKKISIHITNASLQDALDKSLKPQSLSYNIVGKSIVISPGKSTNAINPAVNNELPFVDVKGRVVNEVGEPVIASIVIKGTNTGTNSNENGEFILHGVSEGATLLISGIGIETTEIRVSEPTVNVIVKISMKPMEETVIKGYYTVSRRFNTGSVSKVSSSEIERQPISNPLEAINGRMAGVYVQQTTGLSGGGFNLEIRGQNSLRNLGSNNGNLPLYIIDGVPISSTSLDATSNLANQILPLMSPLNAIAPSDIESIEILKDADATAIYGSRGANGVVLITTKKGRVGKTKVDLNIYTGAGKVTRMMELLNSQQFLEMRHEAYRNNGTTTYPAAAYDLKGTWDTTRYTDWQKELIGGTSNITNLQTSLSGGNANTQFLFGANYFRQGTVFPGDFSDQKFSGHLTVNHVSDNKKLTAAISFSFLNDRNNLPSSDPTAVSLSLTPVAPELYTSEGKLNWQKSTWNNPMSNLQQIYRISSNNLIFNINTGYRILNTLQAKISVGYTTTNMDQRNLITIASQNPAFSPTGTSTTGLNSFVSWIAEPQLEYQDKVGNGEFTAQIGSTFQENILQNQSVFAIGYTSDALLEDLASAAQTFPSSNYTKYRYTAVFGRLNYTYASRYLLNLTGRRDGSSRFGPGRQFANFGAVGLGWIFSSESFIMHSFPFLTYGKLRGSYGVSGSDQIPDYGYLDAYTSVTIPYNGTPGLSINRLFNADYGWEENKKLEAAVELGFLKDRIYLTTSYYRNRSSNQLVGYPLPTQTGQNNLPFYNLPATVQNTGWEFELRTINVNTKAFRWSTSANLSIPKNKLVSFPNLESSSYATTYVVGQPLYGRRSFTFTGVDPQTGLYTFLDVNKNGSISSPEDLTGIAVTGRKFFGGLQNNLTFKSFSLDFLFQFVKQAGLNYLTKFSSPGTLSNQPTEVLKRWQKQGDISNIQRFAPASTGLTVYNRAAFNGDNRVSDASFIRLKNVSLSYAFSKNKLGKYGLGGVRIYVQGQNLLTFTKYLGLDPETQSFYNVPTLKILTAGVQVTL
jgi:TonB-linked SusC/RagA family outer membrane protein